MAADTTVQLAWDIATRDGTLTKDAKMGNVLVQKDSQGVWLQKRPGLFPWQVNGGGLAAAALGIFNFQGGLVAVSAIGASDAVAYKINTTSGGTGTSSYTITGSGGGGIFSFVIGPLITGMKNSAGLWSFTFAGAVGPIAGGFPALTQPGLANLDGTYYVMTSTTIYASAYGDISTWPGLNTVTLSPTYGGGTVLASHLNYIVAFSLEGVQFFYDAGISPGAPIAQVQGGAFSIGCGAPYSLASYEDVLYFLGRDSEGSLFFGSFSGLTFSRLSTAAIERILMTNNILSSSVIGTCGVVLGKAVYLLYISTLALTLVYDIKDQIWDYWTTSTGGTLSSFNGLFINSPTQSAVYPNKLYVQGLTDNMIYSLEPTTYQDNGQPISCFIRTQQLNSGTYAIKFVAAAYLHSDTINTTVSVTYSNDDYQTSAVARTIDMSTQKKQLIRAGSYRQRSWDLLHTDNTAFRVMSLELDFAPTGADNQ